jgi:hypothetical protein
MSRLSAQEIREAVSRMRMKDEFKELLIRRALAGEQEARFAIFALVLREQREGKELNASDDGNGAEPHVE